MEGIKRNRKPAKSKESLSELAPIMNQWTEISISLIC